MKMNHIVTKSEIETKARVKYAEAKPSVMVADDALIFLPCARKWIRTSS